MAKYWILINGVLAAVGAIIAGGHILTVLSAFVAAPITSLNPTIAAGWVSGLTEAWIRKPRVEDFENLAQDITTIKGFRKNEITKILLVVVLSNVGSMIGTFIWYSGSNFDATRQFANIRLFMVIKSSKQVTVHYLLC